MISLIENDYEKEMQECYKELQVNGIKPTIAILGTTGCGKSTLINTIFGKEIAKVSNILAETQEFEMVGDENINLIDSKGYELLDNTTSYIERLKKCIDNPKEFIKNSSGCDRVHLVWFCLSITKKRVESIDLKTLEALMEMEKLKGRVIVVLTKCDEDDEKGTIGASYKKILKEKFSSLKVFEVSNDENLRLELDSLIEESANSIDNEDIKDKFISIQKSNLDIKKWSVDRAIKKYVIIAGGVGATPIPFSDSALLLPIQMKMVAEITSIYGIQNLSTISQGIVSNTFVGNIGKSLAGTALKFIPGVGTVIGGAINTTVASGITYALGKAFSEICYTQCKRILVGDKKVEFLNLIESIDFINLLSVFFDEYTKKSKK